jgi:hypothetical protein
MALFFLDLATLKDLDNGKAAIAFRRAVEDCTKDCQDRPTEERARKITLELSLTPVAAEDAEFEGTFRACGVTGEFKIKSAIPNRQTRPYSFGLDAQGRLFFSQESPTNVNQTTFEDVNPATGNVDRGSPRE